MVDLPLAGRSRAFGEEQDGMGGHHANLKRDSVSERYPVSLCSLPVLTTVPSSDLEYLFLFLISSTTAALP